VTERHELIKAQRDLCRENQWPFFAPYSGYCYSCQKDTVTEWWATSHITYCTRCNRSFCD
jgi:hypothetical protein